MNRKQRIIISLTGIILVTLTLIGFTYGYYLTKINGNSTAKKYQAISKVIRIEYSDGKETLSSNINDTFTPGSIITKTFTVTNTGDDEIDYIIYLENVTNTFTRYNDITYELYDSSNTKIYEGIFPKTDNVISDTYKLKKNESTTYTLKVIYNNSKENQIVDSGKKIDAKISFVGATLKNAILTNAKNATGERTIYQETPTTIPGQAVSTETERTLSKTEDDYGDSYYFRGNVIDNYVNFAGMCWRIVRIQGDGSIKLILASEDMCNDTNLTTTSGYATDGAAGIVGNLLSADYGYKIINEKYINDYIGSTIGVRSQLNSWIERKIINDKDKTLLKNDSWCIGDRTTTYDVSTYKLRDESSDELIKTGIQFHYSSGRRLRNYIVKTLVCDGNMGKDGEIDTNIVGLLTADEVAYAGGKIGTQNNTFYLSNNAKYGWYVLALSYFQGTYDRILIISADMLGSISIGTNLNVKLHFRPVILIKPISEISGGDGTLSNPYIIS